MHADNANCIPYRRSFALIGGYNSSQLLMERLYQCPLRLATAYAGRQTRETPPSAHDPGTSADRRSAPRDPPAPPSIPTPTAAPEDRAPAHFPLPHTAAAETTRRAATPGHPPH